MKSIFEWHALQDGFVRLLEKMEFSVRLAFFHSLQAPLTQVYKRTENAQLLRLLPHMPLMWRLTAAENIILSGFQLELYAPHERTFAYWYLTQVIETHLGCIEDVLVILPPGI